MAEETLRISGGRLERLQCISAVLGIAAAVVVTSSLSAAVTVTSVVIIASLATRDTIVLGLQREAATIESMRVVCLKRSAYLLRHVVIEKGASSSSSSSNGEGTEWGGEMRLGEITPWMEIA